MNFSLILMIAMYFVIVTLFAVYAFMNVSQTRMLQEWNDKTDVEINALKERNIDLEQRIKKMEHDLNGSIIEQEPEFQVKR